MGVGGVGVVVPDVRDSDGSDVFFSFKMMKKTEKCTMFILPQD